MRAVYWAEFKGSWLAWLGVCLTFVAVNFGLVVGALYISTAIRAYELGLFNSMAVGQFSFVGAINILGTIVVGAVVIAASTALVIASRRGSIARLALAGATPDQVVRTIMVQLAIVTAACAILADLIAAVFFPIYLANEVLDREEMGGQIPPVAYDAWVFLGANLLSILVALIAARRQARAASRIPPVEALRPVPQTDTATRRRNWIVRGIIIGLCLLIMVATVATFPGIARVAGPNAGELGFQQAFAMLFLTGFIISAGGPLTIRGLTRAWTAIIPSSNATWFLARNTVLVKSERLTRSVTPVMFAVALMFGLIGVNESLMASYTASGQPLQLSSSGPWAMFSILGMPVLVAIAGSVGSLIMMARQRDAELALASIVGATPTQRLLLPVLEAVIITVTALILGLIMSVVGIGYVIFVMWLLMPAVAVAVPWGILAGVIGVSLVVAIAATLIPTLPSLRKPAPTVIARLVAD